ncbi:MAG: TRAP transporter small permease subunit [Alphaproteobacteria bacterium]|nr:TRAP transporter small permease subunit [Alphaproteobacteria bacterium]
MTLLLRLCRAIDALNQRVGQLVYWAVLIAVLVSAGNAVSRYALNIASNAWLELQWYLFAAVFLLCSGYTLFHNEHIRIDLFAARLSERGQAWLDILGGIFFLLPMTIIIGWLSWPYFLESWSSGEISSNAGGLIRWPAKLMITVGFLLLTLQGASEVVKRIAFLMGAGPNPAARHQPHGAHGEAPAP